jgi:SAM-dependent methyltransferase
MLTLPHNPSNDDLPDVSSVNWIELAELREAVQRSSITCYRGNAYNIQRAINLAKAVKSYLPRQYRKDGCILELGCGNFNPFAIGLRFYLNGYSRMTAIDSKPVYRPYIAARWMYEAAMNAVAFPQRWLFEHAEESDAIGQLRSRAYALPLAELSEGKLDSLYETPNISFQYFDSKQRLELSTCDFIYSIAVLEHVMNPATDLAWQYDLLRPGGYHFLNIGLEDHRHLENPKEFQPWSFMQDGIYGMDHLLRDDLRINGLRSSQYRALIENAGFIVEIWEEEKVYDTPANIADLVRPEFRHLPPNDLTTFRVKALIQKPPIPEQNDLSMHKQDDGA